MSHAHSQIAAFIQLINERMFAGSQLAALQALWSEHTHFDKCDSVVLRGPRMGQVCGKPSLKGKQTCLCHQPREPKVISVPKTKCSETLASGKPCPRHCAEESDKCQYHLDYVAPGTCVFTLVGGPRKGQDCGKTCKKGMAVCTSHVTGPEVVAVVEPEVVAVVEPEVVEPEVVESTCDSVLKSGPNKGTRCGKKRGSGKKMCIAHSR